MRPWRASGSVTGAGDGQPGHAGLASLPPRHVGASRTCSMVPEGVSRTHGPTDGSRLFPTPRCPARRSFLNGRAREGSQQRGEGRLHKADPSGPEIRRAAPRLVGLHTSSPQPRQRGSFEHGAPRSEREVDVAERRREPRSTREPRSMLTVRIDGQLVVPTVSRSPQSLSLATPGSCSQWLETVSLGDEAWSTTSTRYPRRASSMAGGRAGAACSNDDCVVH